MDVIDREDRLRRAKYLGALADRLFSDECARLGLDAKEAIRAPLMSIISRQRHTSVMPIRFLTSSDDLPSVHSEIR